MANNKDKKDNLGRIGRVEREEKVKKNVRIATTIVLVLVASVLIYGIITEFIIFPNQAIATVDGEVLLVKNYQSRVKFERSQLVNSFNNWYNYYYNAVQSGDEFTTSYAENELQKIQAELDVESLGLAILNSMVEEIIVRHEADKLGITVTDEEVDEKLQTLFGYYPNGESTPTAYPTLAATSTLTAQQISIVAANPPILSETEVVEEEPSKVEEVATEIAETIPTVVPTEYTYDAYQESVDIFLEPFNGINFKYDDLVNYVSAILFREKVQYALTNDLPKTEEQVWARHILVETELEALDIYDRIANGDDFAELATEFSIDTSNASRGGDLNWFGFDSMIPEFSTVAFNTAIGEMSEPVETVYGFHLIQVVGHEERSLSHSGYIQLQSNEFINWLIEKVEEYDVQIEDYWKERIPSEPALPTQINSEQ